MEKVKEMGLPSGKMYYTKGTDVWQMNPKKRVGSFAVREQGHLYFIKNGDLYKARVT